MQDYVNDRTISVSIKGGRISAEILKKALVKVVHMLEKEHAKSVAGKKEKIPQGKQGQGDDPLRLRGGPHPHHCGEGRPGLSDRPASEEEPLQGDRHQPGPHPQGVGAVWNPESCIFLSGGFKHHQKWTFRAAEISGFGVMSTG